LLAHGGGAHASAQPYKLEAQLSCGSVLQVSVGPNFPAIQHQITITGTFVTRWDDYDETGFQLVKHPIQVDGLEVGSQLSMMDGDLAQGISYDLVDSPLVGAEGLTFRIEATRTYTFENWIGGVEIATLDEYSATPVSYEDDCPLVAVPTPPPVGPGPSDPTVVNPPVVEPPAATAPPTTVPAVTESPDGSSSASTVPAVAVPPAPEQKNPGLVAVTDQTLVQLSPASLAAQTLPSTGSDLTLLAGAVAALTLGLAMVGATRRR